MPRFATLDLGSNSVLLLVADLSSDGRFHTVLDHGVITRLGEGLESGRLTPEAMARTLSAVAKLVRRARELNTSEIAAVGTAALRQAVNATELLDRLQRELDLPLRVIGGEEEARLSFLAARLALPLDPGGLAAIDVGGGSTELIFGTRDCMDRWTSLPVGALSLTRNLSDPVQPHELARLEGQLADLLDRETLSPTPDQVVGIGGAVTTLAAVELGLEPYEPDRVHGVVLTVESIRSQAALYSGLAVAERREIAGLPPARADTILAGALIVEALLRRLGCPQLTVCDRGLRHGLMQDRFGL